MPCTAKKTVELIVQGGNDYLIAVKGNQKKLYQQIQVNMQKAAVLSSDTTQDNTRGRFTQRRVSVFGDRSGINSEWVGLRRLIRVERSGTRQGKPYEQTAYYISSLEVLASEFGQGIRGHWGIENGLHWTKDVVLKEDSSTIRTGNAPVNFSIVRSFAINLLRNNGYRSLTKAKRVLKLEQLCRMVE